MTQAARNLNGAQFPCFKCGLSQNNSVHRDKTQFGFVMFRRTPPYQGWRVDGFESGD